MTPVLQLHRQRAAPFGFETVGGTMAWQPQYGILNSPRGFPMDEGSTQFLMRCPCFVTKFVDEGIVSLPLHDSRALVVLSDIDLAERFVAIVTKESKTQLTIVEIATLHVLLLQLRTARLLGASFVVLDPEGFTSRPCKLRYHKASIDAIIQKLEGQEID